MNQDYQEYLKSEGWKAKRAMILNMWENRCALCNEGGELHLHHRDYKRVGNEDPFDLIPLCKKHHEMVHEKDDAEVGVSSNAQFTKLIRDLGYFCGCIDTLYWSVQNNPTQTKVKEALEITTWQFEQYEKNGYSPSQEELDKYTKKIQRKYRNEWPEK